MVRRGIAHQHGSLCHKPGLGEADCMTNVGQTATADLVSAATSPAPGGLVRLLGIIAVALAVVSALVTFVVLAGLTPIAPTHNVVVLLLAINIVTVVLLLALIGRH